MNRTLKTLAIALFSFAGATLSTPAFATEFLSNPGDGQCPAGYRLAEKWEVQADVKGACATQGPWYISRIAQKGSFTGSGYGCTLADNDTRVMGASLCVKAPTLPEALGSWAWTAGGGDRGITELKANGECKNTLGTMSCVWLIKDAAAKTFTVNWDNGRFIDILTVSPDGQTLNGKNQHGTAIVGKRR